MLTFRAIETRRPLLRSANRGQTGHVDVLGRAHWAAGPGEEAVVLVPLSPGRSWTFYTAFGDLFVLLTLVPVPVLPAPGYTCQPPEAEDAQCSAAAPERSCAGDYFCGCDGTDCGGFTHGVPPEPNELCTARKALGETCQTHFECLSGYCNASCVEPPGPGGLPTDLCW